MTKNKKKNKIKIIIDTREQIPFDFSSFDFLEVERGTLPFGDYSIKWPNLLDCFVIERKSLADFSACVGRERYRFEKELLAMRGYRWKFVFCEFGLDKVESHEYRSMINPKNLLGSIAKWQGWGIQFIFANDAKAAAYIAAKTMYFVSKQIMDFAECRTSLAEPI